jgi:signal recognition particle GTPase
MKTQRERAEERRNLKLQDVERQVENGSLVIRSMTKEERKRFPAPDPNRPQRKRRWA